MNDFTIQDRVKRLYQQSFGPGHLVSDEEACLDRLETESASIGPAAESELLFENLGNGLCRINLRPYAQTGLPLSMLNRMFVTTANSFMPNPKLFEANLDSLATSDEDRAWIEVYKSRGCPAPSHSPQYRRAYAPSYRVIYVAYAQAFNLIRYIYDLPKGIIAIDGKCASGKSTLAALLGDLFGISVLHLDDFFLRPEQRTEERLKEPGGNFDRERFAAEALTPLTRGMDFIFRPYNCAVQELADPMSFHVTPVTIVEGVYCQHPDLRDAYSATAFLTTDDETQRERLLARNGPDMLVRFENEWIPMENRYFEAFDIEAQSDFVIRT